MCKEEELVNQILGDVSAGDGDTFRYDETTKSLRRASEVGKHSGTTDAVPEDFDLSGPPGGHAA